MNSPPEEPFLNTLRGGQPPTFKQLKWRLVLATLGLILVAFIFLGALGLFELQRTSAVDVESREWRQLQQMVEQMGSDEGARTLYAQAGARIQGSGTEEDFLARLGRDRRRLEALPSHVPKALWGPASCTVQDHGKVRRVWISYRTPKGLRISARWDNGTLTALSLN